jgi:UTP--glucose-1-phosphate uridylyltransferase
MTIRKAVIPAAGLGTRFLPATKVTPKEMLPVVDKPALQYVVEEASAVGLTDVLVITGRAKYALEDHFDAVPELEAALIARNDTEKLALVREPAALATMHYVRQIAPHGLGHAVSCARQHVGNEPFAVLLGDDLIDPRDPLLTEMLALAEHTGESVIALMPVPPEMIDRYGCAEVVPLEAGLSVAGTGLASGEATNQVRIKSLVEKPAPEDAPSNLAIIGRYVLQPAVFEVLERTQAGAGGEIQLTDALATLATMPTEQGGGVTGVVFQGRRYDTGNQLDYLKAVVQIAAERSDLGPAFRDWLAGFVHSLEGPQ